MPYTALNNGIALNNAYTGEKQRIQNFLMMKCSGHRQSCVQLSKKRFPKVAGESCISIRYYGFR
jgi:hypothetical protein